jgi:hypothetical protein
MADSIEDARHMVLAAAAGDGSITDVVAAFEAAVRAQALADEDAKYAAVLRLNDYQAANLRAALEAVGMGMTRVTPSPLGVLNSGDWAGELWWMVKDAATGYPTNGTPESYAREANRRALADVQALVEALERIRSRSQRIIDGEVETTALGAALYNVEVADAALAPFKEHQP